MDNALNQAIINATKEIMESVLNWKVQSRPPVEKVINSSSAETSVIISFVGNISGAFTLKCSKKLAAEIASQMLGMEIETDSEDMQDAIGEMLNMIVGSAKTNYSSGNGTFKISVPTTIIGEDYTLHIKADSSDKISLLEFEYNHYYMSIEVYLT